MKKIIRPACFTVLLFVSSCGSGGKKTTGDTSKNKDSIAMLNEKIRQSPDNLDLYIQRAKVYEHKKDYASALADVNRVLRVDSSKADYLLLAGDLYFFTGKDSTAQSIFTKAVQQHPDNVDCILRLAQLNYFTKHYDRENDLLDKALHLDVHNAQAYFMKGMLLKETFDTIHAIASMQSAVEQDPDYYDAYMQLGLLCSAKNNPLAESYYMNALKIQPQSREAAYGLGMFYMQNKQWDQAVGTFKAILKFIPDDYDAQYNVGVIVGVQQGKYAEGISDFSQAIQDNEKDPRGYYARGVCYLKNKDLQNAVSDFKQALVVDPQNAAAARMLDSLRVK